MLNSDIPFGAGDGKVVNTEAAGGKEGILSSRHIV
jgi:hypothetical protein